MSAMYDVISSAVPCVVVIISISTASKIANESDGKSRHELLFEIVKRATASK